MSVVAELVTRARISDPQPAYCVACFQSPRPGLRFVDFQAVAERGTVVDPISGGVIGDLHELHVCEECLRSAAETLDFRPELHRRHVLAVQEREQRIIQLEGENVKLRSLLTGSED